MGKAVAKEKKKLSLVTVAAILAGIGTFLGAVVGVISLFQDANPPPSTESNGRAASSGVPTATDYYTLDGSVPRQSPTCEGLFTFCLGNPVQEAVALLGQEDERYAGLNGGVIRQWRLGTAFVTIEADRVGAMSGLTAALQSPDSEVRMALSGSLVLGEITMGQVLDARGEPDETVMDAAENFSFYTYVYCAGPEGSVALRYSFNAEIGSLDDPGGFNSDLVTSPVLSYSVERGC
jgi:hypothetical protein